MYTRIIYTNIFIVNGKIKQNVLKIISIIIFGNLVNKVTGSVNHIVSFKNMYPFSM